MSDRTFGAYRLIAELGQGGMANVYLAVRQGPEGSGFAKLMVLKRLRPDLAKQQECVDILVDEARIAALLNHVNVVQTHEIGEVDGEFFIAMEYLEGQPLHRLQAQAAKTRKAGAVMPLTREQQYLIVMDALAGLHHAHELVDFEGTSLNLVHRDMTPHNMFVTYDGHVKILDFGVAKAVGRTLETRRGSVTGKVRYMAPEQAIGAVITRRADIFSMGIILWEIATGKRMWEGMDDLEIVQALASGSLPPSPRVLDPTVPRAIDAICNKALAIREHERYETAEDFRAAIERFLAETGNLAVTRSKLATSMAMLFMDKKLELRRLIETQLAELDITSNTRQRLVRSQPDSRLTPRAVELPTRHSPAKVEENKEPSVPAPPVEADRTSPVVVVQPRKRRRFSLGVAAAAMTIAAVLALVSLQGMSSPSTHAAAISPDPQSEPAAPPPPVVHSQANRGGPKDASTD